MTPEQLRYMRKEYLQANKRSRLTSWLFTRVKQRDPHREYMYEKYGMRERQNG